MTRRTGPPRDTSASAGILVVLLSFLGLVGVGRLAMEAWLLRPAPESLPEIGGTATTASPFLLVVLDGVREAAAFGDDAAMPYFAELGARGATGIALAGNPTLTAACVRSLLTGRAPDLVAGFRNFDARPVGGSLIEFLKRRGGRTAHGGDANVAQLCVRWFDPQDVLAIPDRGPTDQGQSDDLAVPFVLGKVREGFDVVSMHLTRPDHAGHRHGAMGQEYFAACRRADEQVREVVEAFLDRHPDATVLVAADHGVTPAGTHGGGEIGARRAPFALVGPRVERTDGLEIDQCSLAPTIAALLGLPQPALADAPPRPELLRLTAGEEARALDAYLEARAEVARSLGRGGVDWVAARRAEAGVKKIAPERTAELLAAAARLNDVLRPSATGRATMALLLAAFWLCALVRLASVRAVFAQAARRAAALAGLAVPFAMDAVPGVRVEPVAAGILVAAATGVALLATRPGAWRGGGVTLACLGALPVLTGAGLTVQAASEVEGGGASGRAWVAFGLLAGLTIAAVRWRDVRDRLVAMRRRAPGLVAACGGAVVGFLLSLRPFVNPFVALPIVVAALALVAVGRAVLGPPGRGVPAGWRVGLAAAAAVLLVGSRVADKLVAADSWVAATPRHDDVWLLLGVAGTALLAAVLPRRGLSRADLPGLATAFAALALAYAVRLDPDPGPWLARGTTALGIAALVVSFLAGSPAGRLAVRLLAATALARRLTVLDAEFAAFTVLAVGAAIAARWPAPRTRAGVAWLAVGLLVVRTAAFHAMGATESFSTVDVAAGFVGIRGAAPGTLDAAGGGRVTAEVVEATAQLALRFALPWVLLLAAAAAAFRDAGGLRRLVADLALSFAARGAAIATALWAWWKSAWWMSHAASVYALGTADVVLLLAASTLLGAWTPDDRRARTPRRGSGAAGGQRPPQEVSPSLGFSGG